MNTTKHDNMTAECIACGESFSLMRPCCCDDGNNGNGNDVGSLHTDGVCVLCCHHPTRRVGEVTNNDL